MDVTLETWKIVAFTHFDDNLGLTKSIVLIDQGRQRRSDEFLTENHIGHALSFLFFGETVCAAF